MFSILIIIGNEKFECLPFGNTSIIKSPIKETRRFYMAKKRTTSKKAVRKTAKRKTAAKKTARKTARRSTKRSAARR
jgi:hypothetical protein